MFDNSIIVQLTFSDRFMCCQKLCDFPFLEPVRLLECFFTKQTISLAKLVHCNNFKTVPLNFLLVTRYAPRFQSCQVAKKLAPAPLSHTSSSRTSLKSTFLLYHLAHIVCQESVQDRQKYSTNCLS